MMTEQVLIEGCRQRDRKSQKVLYDKYSTVMLGVCIRYTRNRQEAEDVMQEGFVKIFTHIDQFSGFGSFEGWMRRIMVNTAISYYRQNLKYYYQQDINEINETQIESNDTFESDFTIEELLNAIKELPKGYQMVFNLYAIEGYMHKEIAEMLGIDIGTSKSQFSRAKVILQNKLAELSKEKSIKLASAV